MISSGRQVSDSSCRAMSLLKVVRASCEDREVVVKFGVCTEAPGETGTSTLVTDYCTISDDYVDEFVY